MAFSIEQDYSLQQNETSALVLTIRNRSDSCLLFKVQTSASVQDNIKVNAGLFPLRNGGIYKLYGSYIPPCQDTRPQVLIQAIEIGDNDPILYESSTDTFKHVWNEQVERQRQHGKYYEQVIVLSFSSKNELIGDQNALLIKEDEIKYKKNNILLTQQAVDNLERRLQILIKEVNYESVTVEDLKEKIKLIKLQNRKVMSIGGVGFTKMYSAVSILLGIISGVFIRKLFNL